MYLKTLNITNFRKFGGEIDSKPGIKVILNSKLNVLIGENDSGKTAIIDAIRYLVGSVSDDYDRITEDDFYQISSEKKADQFNIEGIFVDLSDEEAGIFLEWLSFDENNNYELRVSLNVQKVKKENSHEYIERKLWAGPKHAELRLEGLAREILKSTYLKPLRDANHELKPGFKSRLAQILKAHPALRVNDENGDHQLVKIMKDANKKIEDFFKTPYEEEKSIVSELDGLLKDFFSQNGDELKKKSIFEVTKADLNTVLKRLSLSTEDINSGLGSLNILFIATELLLLNIDQLTGPNLTLIEEIEAHLHPQAQYRLIKFLEEELSDDRKQGQFIISTHSPSLAASISPNNLILLHNNIAFSMNSAFTDLEENDYKYLERFLDATKSNLFFARGVIFVEGDAENLLVPVLADIIDKPLHKYGVSVVNIKGTSFERYIKLFSRSKKWISELGFPELDIPIAIVTDLDIKPIEYYENVGNKTIYCIEDEEKLEKLCDILGLDKEDVVLDSIGEDFSTYKQLFKAFNIDLSISVYNNYKSDIDRIISKDITQEYILKMKKIKIKKLKDKYHSYNASLSLNISPNWTFEYCLALSHLSCLLAMSIHNCRYSKPTEGKYKEILSTLLDKIHLGKNPRETALEVFLPLDNKIVSKAEVAQYLGNLLLENCSTKDNYKIRMKSTIESDENLKYIVDAIKHVTSEEEDK